MNMDVTFGLFADGGACPEHGGNETGALGRPVVGPAGLVEILETALGIGRPRTAEVQRIAALQARLESLEGERFWSGSFATDPWSTSRTLLGWRDELIGLGWNPERDWASPRLAQLARALCNVPDLAAGLADRLVAVTRELDGAGVSPLECIALIDQPEVLPSPLRRLIARLGELGTVVEVIGTVPAAPADTALGRLQRWMVGESLGESGTEAAVELSADGTVTLASSTSEPLAAEVLGQWFAVQEGARFALVAQEGDTALLDHGLCAAAQPRAGRSRASIHRGSLQILLLAFRNAWSPFDAGALMELLTFPHSPIAPRAARHLASSLEQAPGRGGSEWREAWDRIADGETQRDAEEAQGPEAVERRIAEWKAWAEPTVFDPAEGIPLEEALGICDRVIVWANRRHGASGDMLHTVTASLAKDVLQALAALGHDRVPRLQVERIIDQALANGHTNPVAMAEAAYWRSVNHPGAVWAPVLGLVWWNFSGTHEGTARSPWTRLERAELTEAGCPPDDVTLGARAVSAAWERAVLNARERIVLVSTGLDCNADDAIHPLAHRLKPGLDRYADRVRLEDALTASEIVLAGSTIGRVALAGVSLPRARVTWPVPATFAARLESQTQSATSLENLLSCQLKWALGHVARLRPGRVRSIPDSNRLLGNLAHAIAREIFLPGPPPAPDEAARRTNALVEARIDEMAAPLRMPELAEDLTFARRRLPEAMAGLARCLSENRLIVEATEQQVSGTFEDILALRGAVDLIARDEAGNVVIVDLKWTRSERSRIAELESGSAVQLATYGALVANGAPYRAGYYLLSQRQFATLAGSGLIGRQVGGGRTFPETWTAILADWRRWCEAAERGALVAGGIEDAVSHMPVDLEIAREPKCQWCDYQTLCRVKEA